MPENQEFPRILFIHTADILKIPCLNCSQILKDSPLDLFVAPVFSGSPHLLSGLLVSQSPVGPSVLYRAAEGWSLECKSDHVTALLKIFELPPVILHLPPVNKVQNSYPNPEKTLSTTIIFYMNLSFSLSSLQLCTFPCAVPFHGISSLHPTPMCLANSY